MKIDHEQMLEQQNNLKKKVNMKVTEWREVEHDVLPHSKAFFRRNPHSVTFFDIECCEELVHIVDQIASKVAWRMRVRGPVSSKNNKNKIEIEHCKAETEIEIENNKNKGMKKRIPVSNLLTGNSFDIKIKFHKLQKNIGQYR